MRAAAKGAAPPQPHQQRKNTRNQCQRCDTAECAAQPQYECPVAEEDAEIDLSLRYTV